jgi:hypothetical protein
MLIMIGCVSLFVFVNFKQFSYGQVSKSRTPDDRESKPVVAWVLSSKEIGANTYMGPYFESTDECYDQRRSTIPDSAIKYFATSEDAEKAGFTNNYLAIEELGKYCQICSPLYAYFWDSSCNKILFAKESYAVKKGFQSVDRFDLLSKNGPVFAFEGGKLYYTSCDPEYDCFARLHQKWEPLSCNPGMKKTRVLKFATEAEAREAGYYPNYKYFYDEALVEF